MKVQILLQILFRLLRTRKANAAELARETEVSERSIHRYVEELSVAGVPIDIIRGRKGGICLPDTYRLPSNFFTKEEYAAAVNALSALYEQLHDDALRTALEKLTRQQKSDARDLTLSGNILVDSGTWGDAYGFSETLKFLESAAEARACVDMTYVDREGTVSRRTVEPHLLIYKQNIWYLYAWCRKRDSFRLFRVGRIRGARDTGERFERRHFERADLPLKFRFEDKELVRLRLAVQKAALPDVEEWLGMGSVRAEGEEIFAEAEVPDGGVLLSKLLSFGGSVRVLEPPHIAAQLRERAAAVCGLYPAAQDEEAAAQDGETAAQDGEAAAQDGETATQGGPDRTT